MRYCVLGMGRTGQAITAYLRSKGNQVAVWDRDRLKCAAIRTSGIKTSGELVWGGSPNVFENIGEAVRDADYILVTTVASAHKPVAGLLKGRLRDGQRIVIFNGNMGAYEFRLKLGEEANQKKIVIAETSGMILISDFLETGICHIKSIKKKMDIASVPSKHVERVAEDLKCDFPQLTPVSSILETSLNNANPVLHTPITLFNITRLENEEDYRFYDTAATRSVISFAEKVDSERCKVIKALGGKASTCLEIINSFWTDQYDSLYDAVKNNPAYMSGKGPVSLQYRYLTEDLPYGIAPLALLGRQCGVPTPCIDTMLDSFRFLLDTDYTALAPDLSEFKDMIKI